MFSNYYSYIQDLCKILIPSIITYFATKYSILHPKKYAIREKQFNLVYLPLYLLKKKYENIKYSSDKNYIQKVSSIINKNFQYVFTDTIELLDDIQPLIPNIGNEDLDDEMELATYIFFFNKNIEDNYNFLKKYLGYPTKSPIETFKRDHYQFWNFMLWIDIILIPICIIFSIFKIISSIISKTWMTTLIFSLLLIYGIYQLITIWIPFLMDIFDTK